MDAATAPTKPSITPLPPPPAPPGPLSQAMVRVWPGAKAPAPRRATLAVVAVVAMAANVLAPGRPGLGWPLTGLALAGCALAVARPIRTVTVVWCVAAVALLSVGAVRASGSLFTWCVLGALCCFSLASSGGRTVRSAAVGGMLLIPAGLRGMRWWASGLRATVWARRTGNRLGWALFATVVLVIVFGALFASADPLFAHVVGRAAAHLATPSGGRAIGVAVAVAPLAIGTAYLAAGRPKLDAVGPFRTRSVRRLEWALPLAALVLLFAGFVAVQLEVMFGGQRRVQVTPGLTYAEYARSGFWQLLAVAALSLGVIGVATLLAPKESRADRVTLRALLGTLDALTLVIVASALHRMATYDDAYGYTRLRLAVSVIELWLGAVFVLVLVAGVRLRAAWLPRTAIGLAVCALLAVACLNPDGFIASRNVDRYQRTGRIDVAYLSGLSADAAPALSRLPPDIRTAALANMRARVMGTRDDWRSWNLGRDRMRSLPE
jgi:hypothetical protein